MALKEENHEHEETVEEHHVEKHEHAEHKERKKFSIREFYDKKYKVLLIIPILMLLLAVGQIGFQAANTGDFINKGVSLKGGLTISIEKTADIFELETYLSDQFPDGDISIRALSGGGKQIGVIVEASDVDSDEFINVLEEKLDLEREDYSVEIMGSSLGASFFKETIKALILAFLVMGIVVFLYFGLDWKSKAIAILLTIASMSVIYASNSTVMYTISAILVAGLLFVYLKYSVPSFAVILSAFSDIVVTLAIVNLLGIKLSTAGIAAFLMLIGYSVDTDILLSTKVLKEKEGEILTRIWRAMRTGLMMSATTIIAVSVALSFTQSEILKQIMIIILIGLLVDLVNTWIQNAGILRLYLERKRHHGES